MPGYTPYHSASFTQSWKILKTTAITLGPNDVGHYKLYHKSRSFGSRWLETFSGRQVGHYTKALLFTWVGQPADDGSTLTNLSTSDNTLTINWDMDIGFHFPPKADNLYYQSSPATATPGMANNFKSTGFTIVAPAEATMQVPAGGTGEGTDDPL